MRYHRFKSNFSIVSTRQMKILVSASKHLSFISVKYDSKTDEVVQNEELSHNNILDLSLQPANDPLIVNSLLNKDEYIVDSISFTSICSVMLLILLLISGLWLVKVTMDVYVYGIEGIFNLINNGFYVFPFVVMEVMVIFK